MSKLMEPLTNGLKRIVYLGQLKKYIYLERTERFSCHLQQIFTTNPILCEAVLTSSSSACKSLKYPDPEVLALLFLSLYNHHPVKTSSANDHLLRKQYTEIQTRKEGANWGFSSQTLFPPPEQPTIQKSFFLHAPFCEEHQEHCEEPRRVL